MCGIAGYIGKKNINKQNIKFLSEAMYNRGPDNFSYSCIKIKKNLNLYLFHSRLSIIDLKSHANQPYKFKEYTLIFNGEIYNYLELKKKLKKFGYNFKTNSDTEVLIKMFAHYKNKMFKFLQGMWSFAIWDNKNKKLTLSRDRFGEKPLFYCKTKDELFFSSEINYINILRNKKPKISNQFFRKNLYYGYKSPFLESNLTQFEEIKFLKSSYNLNVDQQLSLVEKKYWKIKNKLNKKISYLQAKKKLRKIIISSLNKTLRSDVDCVFSLSGGIDSSILVNIATKIFKRKIKCYTIYDKNSLYNETSNIIENIKDNPLIDHEFIYPKKINLNYLKTMINFNSNIFYTITACVQNYFYQKISKDGHKVCINGTGADEIFTGYYHHYLYYFSSIKNLKANRNFKIWNEKVKKKLQNPLIKDIKKLDKLKLYRSDYDKAIHKCLKFNNINTKLKSEILDKKDFLRLKLSFETFNETLPVLLYHDDINSMNYSVENRSPYLNHKIFELLSQIDHKYLIKKGFLKYILRDAFKDLLPQRIAFDYTKRGYNYSFTKFLNKNKLISFLFYKNSIIQNYVYKEKFKKLINFKNNVGLNKFIFSILNLHFLNRLNNLKK